MRKLILAASFLAFCGMAQAESVRVSIAGLDLNNPADVLVVKAKLVAAAKDACRDTAPYGYRELSRQNACIAKTLEKVAAKTTSPLLASALTGQAQALRLAGL
jgi:UrcA family protein